MKKRMEMSLSKWPPQTFLLHHAHHGEKSSTNSNLESLANIYGTNLFTEKQFLEMDMDPTTLICVNPYEVNPIMEKSLLTPPMLSVDVPLKGGDHNVAQQNWDTSYGGMFYRPQGKIKLEMEEFSDLSLFLPKPMSTNSVDELNTPVFDKDAFDFNVNVYQKNSQYEEPLVKLELDANYENTCIITDNNVFRNFPLNTEKVHRNENISKAGNNVPKYSDITVFSPQSENGSAYTCQISPSYENTNTNVYNVDDNSALSVSSSKQFSNVSLPTEGLRRYEDGLETPEDSNSSTSPKWAERPASLALHTGLKPLRQEPLNTPSIIEEVVDLESGNFNILDLVANEDITYVCSEDIFGTASAPTLPPEDSTSTSPEPTKNTKSVEVIKKLYLPQKKPRKRRTDTDDDEDYVPPSKRNVLQRRNVVRPTSDSESDSDVEVEPRPKCKPRGRPPRRTESFSSECSKDDDASKYRELRDKNNEASRKSRLKRKMKELEQEKESEELLCRNIKLKAQVEELEKMVTNFRDNLFKIMIKK